MHVEKAPAFDELLSSFGPEAVQRIVQAPNDARLVDRYIHWDKLRHLEPPEGLNSEEWWFKIKFARIAGFRLLPLTDASGSPFSYGLPDLVLKHLHHIDQRCSGE